MPGRWWLPFATSLDLWLLTLPSGLNLVRKSHWFPTILVACSAGTRSQVWFWTAPSNSAVADLRHLSSVNACQMVCGSTCGASVAPRQYWGFGLTIWFCDLVTMRCVTPDDWFVEVAGVVFDVVADGSGGEGSVAGDGCGTCWDGDCCELLVWMGSTTGTHAVYVSSAQDLEGDVREIKGNTCSTNLTCRETKIREVEGWKQK